MQDHHDVRTACASTGHIASQTGVDQERVAILRGVPDIELLDSMSTIAQRLGGGEEFPVFSAVGAEELLARFAVAALIIRERRMSKRLNTQPVVDTED